MAIGKTVGYWSSIVLAAEYGGNYISIKMKLFFVFER